MLRLYGKKGCGKCKSAKEKLDRLGVEWEYVDLESPGLGWRNNGTALAMAYYNQHEELPVFIDGQWIGGYPETMKRLKDESKNKKAEKENCGEGCEEGSCKIQSQETQEGEMEKAECACSL